MEVSGILQSGNTEWKSRLLGKTSDEIHKMATAGTLIGYLETGTEQQEAIAGVSEPKTAGRPVAEGKITMKAGDSVDLVHAKLLHAPQGEDGIPKRAKPITLGYSRMEVQGVNPGETTSG